MSSNMPELFNETIVPGLPSRITLNPPGNIADKWAIKEALAALG